MAAISLPEKGQPLDVSYIYDMASQINNLTNTLAIRSTSTSKVNENTDTTSNLKFYAATKSLTTTTLSNSSSLKESFTFALPEFKFVPVVVATVHNEDNTPAGEEVICTITDVLTSRVEGTVKFLQNTGKVKLKINIIAIGISN